ncbi:MULTISPECIES: type II toxin-antitoxin system TacA family antitoxin [Providencia]|uniref:type II toxin-antitoxin system TacA family antitoxin n=1 Tax=Providencia TaxID=586 RepID=UPI0018E4053C|nr:MULTISPECIES: DUF1778 domain-containing protein [Providencia]MBI6194755.1 DUF1778 domain-containing protein [Providencia rettgeri]MCL0017365.1 DUF1778 domain-containing protein [Providencia rettgeri]MCX9097556.1 DUF1778 domain-containing protein [Providencia rettgeri]MCX9125493.1 DUF1778 domain-containing protein [Providencia rettgeri]MCX9130098.1 DUF1778 domain-containing protein [Providencia rettgeri]
MRNAAINLRALPEQRDLIDEAASLLGKNRSDFMLEVACERAQAILLDQVFFQLDNEKFQQFNLLLDAPVNSNPGLDRLMSIEIPWKEI